MTPESTARHGRTRWIPVVAFAAVAGLNQTLWLTFAPITTVSAEHYGVSEGAIGWLAQIYPLLYVVLALPAGVALDRWFRPALAFGTAVTALGAVVRLGGDTYAWALVGQVLAGIAQPFVLNAVGKLAGGTLSTADRPAGIAIGSAGLVIGQLLGLLLGPLLGSAESLTTLLVVQAVMACVAAAGLLLVLRRPGAVRDEGGAAVGALRTVWSDRRIRLLAALTFVGFGVFIALTTWLQALLEPFGVSDDTAGIMLAAMLLVGVGATAATPRLVVAPGRERAFLGGVLAVAALGCAVLSTAAGVGADAAAVVVVGALLAGSLPVIFELTERRAGSHGGSAVALMWLAGNVGGLLVAVVVGGLLDHRTTAFLVLGAVALAGVPLARRLRADAGPAA
ncbi:MFS transporter [Patulibacter americanus]|uniref:MFS transporter n=1 Tax=Patulibacter americanus TaxID=588672 RepID=UPI0003B53BDE|nr:MFS transporter [Patulibacter americanus]